MVTRFPFLVACPRIFRFGPVGSRREGVRSVRLVCGEEFGEEGHVPAIALASEPNCYFERADRLPRLARAVGRLLDFRNFDGAEGDEHVAALGVVDVLDEGLAILDEGGEGALGEVLAEVIDGSFDGPDRANIDDAGRPRAV